MDTDRRKTVDVYSSAFGGEGICRIDGIVCFVEGAFAGEKAVIEITEKKKNFLRARAVEILVPIPERIESICPLAYSCSIKGLYCQGCVYQSLSYEKEINFKDSQFADLMKKFAGIDSALKLSPLFAKENLLYRNKIRLHSANRKNDSFGFVTNDNYTVIEVPKCYLACNEINEALSGLRNSGMISDEVLLRYTEKDGVKIVAVEKAKNAMELLTERTLFGDFLVPVTSFFQVNIYAHKIMLKEYEALLKKISPDIVVDLYSGVGVFGIIASKSGIPSYGADMDYEAIRVAKLNAQHHGVENITSFLAGDVSLFAKEILSKLGKKQNCVVLDPPRTGLDKILTKMLCDLPIDDIIYISCSADTLCRDLKILFASGYELQSTRLIDMFPRTKHFETITHLKNRKKT